METLALFGGPKTITEPFKPYVTIGKEEAAAVQKVMESGVLSKFLGCWDPDFYGGEQIQAFEREWSSAFDVKHSVAVNSNTSGLMAALGAVGVAPGDEVIVPPWTMCASATSILVWNAIPVFADIEPETFTIDPASIERNITERTKAIVSVDIFGHSAHYDAIMEIAKKHNLKVVEDCAQAPGVRDDTGTYVGTRTDIGVYSLNYHKHIHTGEGGMCVTNDAELAERLQLIRNHAEAVVAGKGVTRLDNMIGFNFRMTELEAAVGREQLKKLEGLVKQRQHAAHRLNKGLETLEGLRVPITRPGHEHAYYAYPLVLSDALLEKLPRKRIVEALTAEGVVIGEGYVNVHQLPMFQQRIAYGPDGFPWSADFYRGEVSYDKGICPVAEDMHERTMMDLAFCCFAFDDAEVDQVIAAFHKVWAQLDVLVA